MRYTISLNISCRNPQQLKEAATLSLWLLYCFNTMQCIRSRVWLNIFTKQSRLSSIKTWYQYKLTLVDLTRRPVLIEFNTGMTKPTMYHSLLSRMTDSTTCVGHIVNKDSHFFFYITDQHHSVHLIGSLSFFVDQSKVDVQAIGDRSYPWKRKRCLFYLFKQQSQTD